MSTGRERRQHQVGLNEASFRNANEGIARGAASQSSISVLCECGRLGCNQLLTLSRDAYEAVRAHPRRFVLLPGHELLEAETVVERHDDHLVVEKHEAAGEVAEQADPRPPLDGD